MFNCVERGKAAEAAYLESKKCKAREHQGSHAGGTDYGPPCKQHVGDNGKHKGNHVAVNGYSWKQGSNDVWLP